MTMRVEPPDTIIYEDPPFTYYTSGRALDFYNELVEEGRIIAGGFTEEHKGYFLYLDKDFPIARCYCPLMVIRCELQGSKQ
jgi:hypothetical protein